MNVNVGSVDRIVQIVAGVPCWISRLRHDRPLRLHWRHPAPHRIHARVPSLFAARHQHVLELRKPARMDFERAPACNSLTRQESR